MNIHDLLRRHEGLRLKPYYCSKNHRTVGYGWNLDNEPPSDIASCLRLTGAITQDMAERLLNISITIATEDCRAIYPGFDTFSEARRFALIDFLFNVGSGTALKFKKMRLAIVWCDWDRAADEMIDSDWFKQVGVRGPEIVGMVRVG
jgi:lysozyme